MTARRRRLRALLITLAALALLVLLAPLVALVFGLTLDAGPWREPVAQAIGRALQREVVFDGPAEITFSLQPALHVGGIRILNPPGFSEPVLATLGDARFRLDLLPLLRRQLRVRELSARDVRLRLELLADGRANWRLASDPDPAPAAAPGSASVAERLREDIARIGVEQLTFERIALEFVPPSGRRHDFSLDSLDAHAAAGEPLTLHLAGRAERSFGYTVDLEGGPLGRLLAGRQPWPLKLRLAFAGTELSLEGELFGPLGGGHADIGFTLQTDDLSQLEQLLHLALPPVGATRLAARVLWQPGLLRLAALEGRMGDTRLQGHLGLSTAGAVPLLTGELNLPVLDLRPFLGQPSASAAPPASLLDTYRELESQSFDLKRLADLDADLHIAVGRWQSLPGEIGDARLQVLLQGGVLHSPVALQAAGVPLTGVLDIDSRPALPQFSLALATTAHRLGGLAKLLAGLDGIDGDVDRLDLRLQASGATPGDLTRSLDVALALEDGRLAYGQAGGGRPVEFRLDRLELALPAAGALQGQARGALLEEPFSAHFGAGSLPALARDGHWPLTVQLAASGARLGIDGRFGLPETGGAVDLRFALDAPRAGSVARWLGLAPGAAVPLHLGGRLQRSAAEEWLRDFSFSLGATRMGGEFGRVGSAGGKPLFKARLAIEQADLAELQTLLPPPAPRAAGGGLTLELPILPRGIDLSDADVVLRLQRLLLPAAEVADIRFDARVRDGRMADAPFSAVVAGTPFSGTAAVDLRGAVPEVALHLAAAKVDIGDLLHRLQLAEGIDAGVGELALALTLRGSRLGELLERSDLAAELHGGHWALRDPAGRPLLAIAVGQGRVEALAGQPLGLTLAGAIDSTPVTLRVESGRLPEFAGSAGQVPLRLQAEAAGARLELDGRVPLPLGRRGGELTLRLAGEHLDSLDALARTSLPPWGPWSVAGRFVENGRRYEMPDLALRVGSSRLDGQGALDFAGERPRVELALSAPQIQLDDFPLAGWSAVQRAPAPAQPALDAERLRDKARAAAEQGQQLLSRTTLLRADAALKVEVLQVRSGADRLGSGRLHARLQDARLEIDPLAVQVPGGAASVALSYEPLPGDEKVRLAARAQVDRFDYAVLARRVRPDSDLQGRFSLDLELAATAPLAGLMPAASGRLDLAVWPVNLKSGVFDLWAVNLFVALLPELDSAAASRVNCAVVRFDLRDGRLTQDSLLVDTTRMRVGGSAQVDFHDESVAVHLQPRPKRPQFFSLAPPVEVSGHIADFKVGLAPGSLLGSAARFLGSIVTTPFEMITAGELPADGADVCTDAMRDGVAKGANHGG